jgi:hypothetical protein
MASNRGAVAPARFAGSIDEALMFVTEEEAATIYAKACRSWYGARAASVVHSQVKKLMAKGDGKGVKAWQQVARALESLSAEALEDEEGMRRLTRLTSN